MGWREGGYEPRWDTMNFGGGLPPRTPYGGTTMVTLDRKLYLNADKTALVEEGDPAAAYVFGTVGTEITKEEADRLGYAPRMGDDELLQAQIHHAATHHARLPDPLPPAYEVVDPHRRGGFAMRGEDKAPVPGAPSLLEQEVAKFQRAEQAGDVEEHEEAVAQGVEEAEAAGEKTGDPSDLPTEKIEEKQEAQRAEDAKAVERAPATKAVKGPSSKK